ncbi:hypothetical protein AAHH59_06180 [Pediococcus acidilactici]|uniref:hypothetical protein n=2 Tax=Pediococcus acidilactici TaxID=1254 RepID=UPI00300D832B
MTKNTSMLLITIMSALLLTTCTAPSHSSTSTGNASHSSKKVSKNHRTTTPAANSSKQHSTNAPTTGKPLTFDEGMQILRRSVYKDLLADSPQLVSNQPQKLVISTYAGAKGINYFTLTMAGTNQVQIHAKFGTLDGGKFTQLHDVNLPEYQTITRASSNKSASNTVSKSSAFQTNQVPTKFIGKWKKSDKIVTNSDGKRYEYAQLFHGRPHSITLGTTYADLTKYTVLSCKPLGNNDYVLKVEVPLSHETDTFYLHYYSKDHIGVKTSSSNGFMEYNSKAPVLNYNATEW